MADMASFPGLLTWSMSTQHEFIDNYVRGVTSHSSNYASVVDNVLRAIAESKPYPFTKRYKYIATLWNLERALETLNYARDQYDEIWIPLSEEEDTECEEQCAICFEHYEQCPSGCTTHKHVAVKNKLCGHVFGSGCILHTLTPFGDRSGKCPMCRGEWAMKLYPGWPGLPNGLGDTDYLDPQGYFEIALALHNLYIMLLLGLQRCEEEELRDLYTVQKVKGLIAIFQPDPELRARYINDIEPLPSTMSDQDYMPPTELAFYRFIERRRQFAVQEEEDGRGQRRSDDWETVDNDDELSMEEEDVPSSPFVTDLASQLENFDVGEDGSVSSETSSLPLLAIEDVVGQEDEYILPNEDRPYMDDDEFFLFVNTPVLSMVDMSSRFAEALQTREEGPTESSGYTSFPPIPPTIEEVSEEAYSSDNSEDEYHGEVTPANMIPIMSLGMVDDHTVVIEEDQIPQADSSPLHVDEAEVEQAMTMGRQEEEKEEKWPESVLEWLSDENIARWKFDLQESFRKRERVDVPKSILVVSSIGGQ